ncbi:hypothetical protein Sjap_009847 [Stephania japonica]|uniref:ornithine decarboxylase n=1 Tax=Stephania japonica TaxID=461633 RepID=A0AAP0JA27_9MAGN
MPRMQILDIGGGFTAGSRFDEMAKIVKDSINTKYKSEISGLMVMAEPGRFFAETSFTLVANITGKRVRDGVREYWINDGIYGTMSGIIYKNVTVTAMPLACTSNKANPTCRGAQTYSSTVFGPTMDSLDAVLTDYQLPEMQVNDWLVFPNMGAYTAALGSSFNGFKTSAIVTHLGWLGRFCYVKELQNPRNGGTVFPTRFGDGGEPHEQMDSKPSHHPTIYAVKCNPDPAFLSALAALGAGFDCASNAEIEAILALRVSADRIVFANTCKAKAASVGVNLATFDSIEEVEKNSKWHPKCALLLRIKPTLDDGVARLPLGAKFGALPEEVVPLLQAAQAARLNVAGVSFHVGSGVLDSTAYRVAIAAARAVFDAATELGMPRMNILDIGGGFTACSQFDETAAIIKAAVHTFDNELPGLRVIAEPGSYFAETSFTLAANIIGKRVRGTLREYWINDGIHGSMNCIIHHNVPVTATPFAGTSNNMNPTCRGAQTYSSTVFGPTCDSLDTMLREYQLPEMQVNDWLVFPNMGAYTAASGSSFNGFKTSAIATHLVITPAMATWELTRLPLDPVSMASTHPPSPLI